MCLISQMGTPLPLRFFFLLLARIPLASQDFLLFFLHHKAFVIFHMIVTAQVQHTVCHQERQLALLRLTLFLSLLVNLFDRHNDIAQKKFARLRVKIVI